MASLEDVSAKAGQFVVVSYPYDLPSRCRNGKREVTMPTEQAVDLYNDLRHALFE